MTDHLSWWRAGGKDYGWAFGAPAVVIVEIWSPAGIGRPFMPWREMT